MRKVGSRVEEVYMITEAKGNTHDERLMWIPVIVNVEEMMVYSLLDGVVEPLVMFDATDGYMKFEKIGTASVDYDEYPAFADKVEIDLYKYTDNGKFAEIMANMERYGRQYNFTIKSWCGDIKCIGCGNRVIATIIRGYEVGAFFTSRRSFKPTELAEKIKDIYLNCDDDGDEIFKEWMK